MVKFTPWQFSPVLIWEKVGWAQEPVRMSWGRENSLASVENRTPIPRLSSRSPVAIPNWAIPAHMKLDSHDFAQGRRNVNPIMPASLKCLWTVSNAFKIWRIRKPWRGITTALQITFETGTHLSAPCRPTRSTIPRATRSQCGRQQSHWTLNTEQTVPQLC
jgi:hypothetical protein